MSVTREKSLGDSVPVGLCFPQLGSKAKGAPARRSTEQRRVTTGRDGQGRLVVCALEMEMSNYNLQGDSKVDCVNLDGLISRNGGDSAEIAVPLTQRTAPMEGDNLYRLRDRKFLLEHKKRLCALALGTAVLGIVLMMIYAEACPYMPINKQLSSSSCTWTLNLPDLLISYSISRQNLVLQPHDINMQILVDNNAKPHNQQIINSP